MSWMREEVEHCPSQYGAIKGSSTTLALVDLFHQLLEGLESPNAYARVLMLDFSKGFDRIDHSILLDKLQANGVHPILVAWQKAFLTQRQQRIKINDVRSNWLSINGGVPQGTLSGPEDFLNFVDDLKSCLPNIKYVDDTTVFEVVKAGQNSKLQQATDEIMEWTQKNRMKINTSKTKELLIHFNKQEPDIPPVIIQGTPIERTNVAKLLGVSINDKLTWNEHVESIHKKANSRLHYLRLLKRAGVPNEQLLTAFKALVRSLTEYASQVWSSSLTKTQAETLESIQKRALQIIKPGQPYERSLQELRLDTLGDRRNKLNEKLFQDIKTEGHKLHHLLPTSAGHNHHLRNPSLPLPHTRTKRFKDSFINWSLFHFK